VGRKAKVNVTNGVAVKLKNDGSNKISLEKSKTTSVVQTTTKKTGVASKSPQRSLDRPGSRTSTPATRNISNPVAIEPDPKNSKPASKQSSVMSRLRKLGSPASTPTTTGKSRPVSATKIALNSVSPTKTIKKRAESCPPTSRLETKSLPKQVRFFKDSTLYKQVEFVNGRND